MPDHSTIQPFTEGTYLCQSRPHAAPTMLWGGFTIQMERCHGLQRDSVHIAACLQLG